MNRVLPHQLPSLIASTSKSTLEHQIKREEEESKIGILQGRHGLVQNVNEAIQQKATGLEQTQVKQQEGSDKEGAPPPQEHSHESQEPREEMLEDGGLGEEELKGEAGEEEHRNDGDEGIFEMEKILYERYTEDVGREFKIKWKNYSDIYNTWEPAYLIDPSCQNLVEAYRLRASQPSFNPKQEWEEELRKCSEDLMKEQYFHQRKRQMELERKKKRKRGKGGGDGKNIDNSKSVKGREKSKPQPSTGGIINRELEIRKGREARTEKEREERMLRREMRFSNSFIERGGRHGEDRSRDGEMKDEQGIWQEIPKELMMEMQQAGLGHDGQGRDVDTTTATNGGDQEDLPRTESDSDLQPQPQSYLEPPYSNMPIPTVGVNSSPSGEKMESTYHSAMSSSPLSSLFSPPQRSTITKTDNDRMKIDPPLLSSTSNPFQAPTYSPSATTLEEISRFVNSHPNSLTREPNNPKSNSDPQPHLDIIPSMGDNLVSSTSIPASDITHLLNSSSHSKDAESPLSSSLFTSSFSSPLSSYSQTARPSFPATVANTTDKIAFTHDTLSLFPLTNAKTNKTQSSTTVLSPTPQWTTTALTSTSASFSSLPPFQDHNVLTNPLTPSNTTTSSARNSNRSSGGFATPKPKPPPPWLGNTGVEEQTRLLWEGRAKLDEKNGGGKSSVATSNTEISLGINRSAYSPSLTVRPSEISKSNGITPTPSIYKSGSSLGGMTIFQAETGGNSTLSEWESTLTDASGRRADGVGYGVGLESNRMDWSSDGNHPNSLGVSMDIGNRDPFRLTPSTLSATFAPSTNPITSAAGDTPHGTRRLPSSHTLVSPYSFGSAVTGPAKYWAEYQMRLQAQVQAQIQAQTRAQGQAAPQSSQPQSQLSTHPRTGLPPSTHPLSHPSSRPV